MVDGRPTKEKAEELFNMILNNSNHEGVWNYYNAKFDIKSYEDGVIYEATKPAGDSLKLTELVPGQ